MDKERNITCPKLFVFLIEVLVFPDRTSLILLDLIMACQCHPAPTLAVVLPEQKTVANLATFGSGSRPAQNPSPEKPLAAR